MLKNDEGNRYLVALTTTGLNTATSPAATSGFTGLYESERPVSIVYDESESKTKIYSEYEGYVKYYDSLLLKVDPFPTGVRISTD